MDEHLNIYSCSILNLDFFSKHVSLALNLNFTWSYSCALFVLLQFLLKLFVIYQTYVQARPFVNIPMEVSDHTSSVR